MSDKPIKILPETIVDQLEAAAAARQAVRGVLPKGNEVVFVPVGPAPAAE